MTVTLAVYDRDLTTLIDVLDQPYAIEWARERLDVGAGRFTVPHDSPIVQANPGILDGEHMVVVRDDGTPRFGWLIRRRSRTRSVVWDPVTVAGPGVVEVFRRMTVGPPGGFGACAVPDDTRLFGFMAPAYDDSTWMEGAALFSHGQQEDPTPPNLVERPRGWTDPLAEWIWTEEATGDPLTNTPGRSYFRRVLEVGPGEGARVRLFVTAANSYTAYFDGAEVASGSDYRGFQWIDLDLCENTNHVFSAVVENQTPPANWAGQNIGGLLMSMRKLMDDDTFDTVLYRSHTPALYPGTPAEGPWRALHLPASPPGMTPGHILAVLFDEGQTRGVLTQATRDFTDALDSAGNAWPEEIEFACRVGDDSVMSVAERLREYDVDVELTPGLVFRAWHNRGSDLSGSVTVGLDAAGEQGVDTEDEEINAVVARTQEGWIEEPPAPTADRREGFLSLGLTPSNATGREIAADAADEFSVSRRLARWRTNSAQTDVPQPHDDYDLGDTITAPALPADITADWALLPVRVDSVIARVDRVGDVDWYHEGTP